MQTFECIHWPLPACIYAVVQYSTYKFCLDWSAGKYYQFEFAQTHSCTLMCLQISFHGFLESILHLCKSLLFLWHNFNTSETCQTVLQDIWPP